MTKTTRSRLAGLDLRILATLAALVPGFTVPVLAVAAPAPKAEDTSTETDEEKKKREEKEKDEKAKKGTDDSDADDKDGDKDKEKKPDDQQAKGAKPRVGLGAQIAAALAGFRSGDAGQAAADLTAARATLATEQQAHTATKATLAQRDADLAAARASLESANGTVATLCAYLGVAAADVAGKSAAEITAALDKRVHAQAIEQVKALGFNPEALPAPSGSTGGEQKSKGDLLREFNAITDPNERAAFYAKHEKAMLG